jgi:hypothetical protein
MEKKDTYRLDFLWVWIVTGIEIQSRSMPSFDVTEQGGMGNFDTDMALGESSKRGQMTHFLFDVPASKCCKFSRYK